MDIGHWQYTYDFDINDWFGFVYRIIDTTNKKQYIGKKQFFTHTTKRVKNRKNKKHFHKESDWRIYTGSSVNVNNAIIEKGKDSFLFIIESLHISKASLHYAEIHLQVTENVLREKFENGERKYYNGCISGVKFLPPDEHSDESRAKISASLIQLYEDNDNFWYNKLSELEKQVFDENYRIGNNSSKRGKTDEEYKASLNENFVGKNNPMYGRTGELSPRFGKNPYENLSDERIAAIKSILSIRNSGEGNPIFGKNPHENMTSEELEILKSNTGIRMSGENNPMFGISPTYRMTDTEKQQWKDNISKGSKGRPKSEKAKQNMRVPKGPQKTITCPHCNKTGGISNMSRYHFDKCKKNPNIV